MINKLPQVCKKYQDLVTRRIVPLVISIIADDNINDMYKNLVLSSGNLQIPDMHYTISTSLVGIVCLEDQTPVNFEDMTKMYNDYCKSYSAYKSDDKIANEYIRAQKDSIAVFNKYAKTLNSAKDYKTLSDYEYEELLKAINDLYKSALINFSKLDKIKYN